VPILSFSPQHRQSIIHPVPYPGCAPGSDCFIIGSWSITIKAIGLLSSGIDSALALKLISDQGIEVIAVNIVLPFVSEKKDHASQIASEIGVPLIKIEAGEDFIEMVRNPRHGYGSAMNPCIDCRIYMLREARKIAEEKDAAFIITGDVLGERPMSQHSAALRLEEREAGLKGRLLRPLSARLLEKTVPEQEGWVDRSRLLDINGRSRKPQLALARKLGINGYSPPAGGCLLTHKEFASRLKDLFQRQEKVAVRDISLLKLGRHFRLPSSRIIVGRNKRENALLMEIKNPGDYAFQVPDCGSPTTLLIGNKTREAIELAARLTARYSDADTQQVLVEYRNGDGTENIFTDQNLPEIY